MSIYKATKSFYEDGLPGHWYPGLLSVVYITATALALAGVGVASNYLTEHGAQHISAIGVLLGPWLGYKWGKHLNESNVEIAGCAAKADDPDGGAK